MYLIESHSVKYSAKRSAMFTEIKRLCQDCARLYNAVNYYISQCVLVYNKLYAGELLNAYQSGLAYDTNILISKYNTDFAHNMPRLDSTYCVVHKYEFLAWKFKSCQEFKAVGSVIGQQCLRELSRNWKTYIQNVIDYKLHPDKYMRAPQKPSYNKDCTEGRWIEITKSGFRQSAHNTVTLQKIPEFRIQSLHKISSVRLKYEKRRIRVHLVYKQNNPELTSDNGKYYAIDLGVKNFATVVSNTQLQPFIINGRVLLSINQYYYKKRAELQALYERTNQRDTTKRWGQISVKHYHIVQNYLHQASRYITNSAKQSQISKIIVGLNKGWKRRCKAGKVNNQNFRLFPYDPFIKMLQYKSKLAGIEVCVVNEAYTSGTSYLDGEFPTVKYYNKSRRKARGIFVSTNGDVINADVNAAYQILKKYTVNCPIKTKERVTRINIIKRNTN